MNRAHLEATYGRLTVQRDHLREIRYKLAEELANLNAVIFELEHIITEDRVREQAKNKVAK